MSARRRAAISATTFCRPAPVRAPTRALPRRRPRASCRRLPVARGGRLGGAALRPKRLEQLDAEPRVDGQGRALDPLLHLPDDARHEQRRAGVEQRRRRAGCPARRAGRPRSSARSRPGVPPASRAVAARLNPSAAASIACRSTVSPAHDVGDAAAVERQLVDAVAVDHERPLRAEPADDLGHPGGERPRRRRRAAGGASRPGWSAGRAG